MVGAKKGKSGSVGLWSTVSIGVGGMVGGGIFAVLGLSVKLAEGGAAVAFLIAGLVALGTAYAYSRLSVRFPDQGGTVEFLNRGFGTGLFTGTVNNLLWLSYVVMLSLYAYAFGSYGASFFDSDTHSLWRHGLTSAVVVLMTLLNVFSAKIVGEMEEWLVAFKLLILCLFIAVGLWSVDPSRLTVGAWAGPLPLLAGGMIIFLAYEGFELIANTAEDVTDPRKNLPRAYFISVGFVVALYVSVAAVTVGNLPIADIVDAEDYALAAAAKPFLGTAGFALIAVAAMLSTASAINATLYGAMRVSYIIAKDGELPEVLDRKVWNRPIEGLLISAGATLLVANLFDISSISTTGSAGFLLVFAAVNAANARLAEETSSRAWISAAAAAACVAALAALVGYVAVHTPLELLVPGGMLALAFIVEAVYVAATGRRITPSGGASRAGR